MKRPFVVLSCRMSRRAARSGATSFLASDVMYAESLNRVRTVHLAGGESFRVNMTLAQIFDRLADERFMYCHRSVVVNLDYVRLLSEEMLTLVDGAQLPVGRRRMQEVRAAFKARRG
ncbi:MAG: LytR/AlgR family response regulator transcription factor [Slackia sp.]